MIFAIKLVHSNSLSLYLDIFKSVIIKVSISSTSSQIQQRKKENPARFRNALKSLLNATNPYASSASPSPTSANLTSPSSTASNSSSSQSSVDCCICLCVISPYQALFLSPCSHCYHYKCIRNLLSETHMFQCPMCRQVANLDASVSMESLVDASMEDHLNHAGANSGESEEEDDVREVQVELDAGVMIMDGMDGVRVSEDQWEREMNVLGANLRNVVRIENGGVNGGQQQQSQQQVLKEVEGKQGVIGAGNSSSSASGSGLSLQSQRAQQQNASTTSNSQEQLTKKQASTSIRENLPSSSKLDRDVEEGDLSVGNLAGGSSSLAEKAEGVQGINDENSMSVSTDGDGEGLGNEVDGEVDVTDGIQI
jgi:hypothetical protein